MALHKTCIELLALLAALSITSPSRAQLPLSTRATDADGIERARTFYLDGLKFVREAHWGEALAAFESSQALRPHALTTFNIGACERALGHYTRARQQFARALRENTAGELPPDVASDSQVFLSEIERLLVHLRLLVDPPGTSIAVDGRPLAPLEGQPRTLVAGSLPAGRGSAAPVGWFEVVADPGAHVLTLSRRGYADVVLNKTYQPGQTSEQRLELAHLPATIRVASNEPSALVNVNGKDVGPVPVDVLRPAGAYRVEVSKAGFVPYTADVHLNAGEETTLRAGLVRERSLTGRWWFWTGTAVLVVGVATGTYLLTHGDREPTRPALNGGSLGWTARIP